MKIVFRFLGAFLTVVLLVLASVLYLNEMVGEALLRWMSSLAPWGTKESIKLWCRLMIFCIFRFRCFLGKGVQKIFPQVYKTAHIIFQPRK